MRHMVILSRLPTWVTYSSEDIDVDVGSRDKSACTLGMGARNLLVEPARGGGAHFDSTASSFAKLSR